MKLDPDEMQQLYDKWKDGSLLDNLDNLGDGTPIRTIEEEIELNLHMPMYQKGVVISITRLINDRPMLIEVREV